MKKVAVVIPRFSRTIYDGAEIHALRLVEHLQKFANVTVLTTQAKDNFTWKKEKMDSLNHEKNINVIRFKVDYAKRLFEFNRLNHSLYGRKKNSSGELVEWIKQVGPYSSSLLDFLRKNLNFYNLFFFLGYNNAFTYFGLPIVKHKAVLIPLTHKEPMLRFKIFDRVFSTPFMILPSTFAEKKIILERFSTVSPLFVFGINTEKPEGEFKNIAVGFKKPYCIYIGRVSRSKGVWELIDKFILFKKRNAIDLNLVLIGVNVDFASIPKRNDIYHIKTVDELEKYSLVSNAEFLINPSYYESFSLILQEAWNVKKVVLVNGKCDVLKSQVTLANGGLYYENYEQFEAMVLWLLSHPKKRAVLAENGYVWSKKNYSKAIIEKKIKTLLNALTH